LICTACSNEPTSTAPYETRIDEIQSSFIAQVKKKYDLSLEAFGGSMMDNEISKISLYFEGNNHLKVNEARSLYVTLSEMLLNNINQDKVVRPYLHDYPFTIENFDLRLSFYDKQGRRVSEENVCLIFYVKKKIYYCAYNPHAEKLGDELADLHEETYEAALEATRMQLESPIN